ncbi:MAG TPA: RsmG family class I SAM-dependent methyltransferase [Ilumatobacteraceae bacterium]|nr:RsmG family class I SAM-dependent methyltransferase [Ilumatobacteraceae bacterium]
MLATLRSAQRWGLLGARPVEEVVEHAREFVRALAEVGATPTGAGLSASTSPRRSTVVDIGSGGGVPGLVVAHDRPDLAVTLVDRRQKCTDFLERAVAALGLRERVTVRCCDANALIIAGDRFDAVTARGFGPPTQTLRAAARLIRPEGRILISEPPEGDRWSPDELDALGLARRRVGAVAVFTRAP